jgi:hypothetical protein
VAVLLIGGVVRELSSWAGQGSGLANGVGRLSLAAPAEVTVRAFDAAGTQVAETMFSDDIDQRRSATGEPEIHGW